MALAEKTSLIGQVQIEQIKLNKLPYVDNLIKKMEYIYE